MSSIPDDERRADSRERRWFVLYPLAAGLILLGIAIAWTLAAADTGMAGLLLMLIGGWSLAFAFVNLLHDITPAWLGVALHLGAALAVTVPLIMTIGAGRGVLTALPEPAQAVVLVLQIAAGPAAGWLWFGLIARVAEQGTRQRAEKRSPLVTPPWERDEGGDGSRVSFSAIDIRMRTLTTMIIAVVLVAGLAVTALLIAFDEVTNRLGPRIALILVGVLVALPVYVIILGSLRRRTVACVIAFGRDALRIQAGSARHSIRYDELDRLRWQPRTDYARVEVRAPGVDLSLITGLAKPAVGHTAELPPLPRRVITRLERSGLRQRATRGDVVTLARSAPSTKTQQIA